MMHDEDELELDDLNETVNKKKKINSGDKGKRNERALAKLLKERFGFEFTRTIGSGNRWGQTVFLPAHAQQTFSGDLVCPENFLFVIEAKGGYDDIDLYNLLTTGKHHELDKWLEQSQDESDRSGRKPIICWRKTRKGWLGMVKKEDAEQIVGAKLEYQGWIITSLEAIFDLDNSVFFNS
jgi:Holliday junction resolvase